MSSLNLKVTTHLLTAVMAGAALDTAWLSSRASEVLEGCQVSGLNGTVLFTPDASHSYGAQWTRDFAYMVASAPELLSSEVVKQAVRYTFAGQRADGCMPDRVQSDGEAVMSPGPMMPNNTRNPAHDHAWDNGPFATLLLTATMTAWPDKVFFCSLESAARGALDFVNRTAEDGMVFNDPRYPNATYGFTDTVAKTGKLLFTSLLYLDASRQMAGWATRFGCGDVLRYEREADQIERAIDTMADPDGPLWLAASGDNGYPDVWGSAYLVSLKLSTEERRSGAIRELMENKSRYFQAGQVRSLPSPMHWHRCCWTPGCDDAGPTGCSKQGTYQNGAYWATPLGYVVAALLDQKEKAFAEQLVGECIEDFKANGIYEDVNYEFVVPARGVLNYSASVTNVLWAANRLLNSSAHGS